MSNKILSYILFALLAANMSWNFSVKESQKQTALYASEQESHERNSTDFSNKKKGEKIIVSLGDIRFELEKGDLETIHTIDGEQNKVTYNITNVEGSTCNTCFDGETITTDQSQQSISDLIALFQAIQEEIQEAEKERLAKEAAEKARKSREERLAKQEDCDYDDEETRLECMDERVDELADRAKEIERELRRNRRNLSDEEKDALKDELADIESLYDAFMDEISEATSSRLEDLNQIYTERMRNQLEIELLEGSIRGLCTQYGGSMIYWNRTTKCSTMNQALDAEIQSIRAEISDLKNLDRELKLTERDFKEDYDDFTDFVSSRRVKSTLRDIEQAQEQQRNALKYARDLKFYREMELRDRLRAPQYNVYGTQNYRSLMQWRNSVMNGLVRQKRDEFGTGYSHDYLNGYINEFERLLSELGVSDIYSNSLLPGHLENNANNGNNPGLLEGGLQNNPNLPPGVIPPRSRSTIINR